MQESINGMKRTSMCAELGEANVGEQVTLMGWCHKCRDMGGLIFITLRDRTGEIQLVVTPESAEEIRTKAAAVRSEYVLAVRGDVQLRSAPNDKMKTGKIEITSSGSIKGDISTYSLIIDENAVFGGRGKGL